MAGASRSITVDDTDVHAMLARLGDRAAHMHACWDEVGSAMVDSTHERFARQAGPDGTPWQPSQRVLAEGGQTLTLSRKLAQSQTHLATDHGVEWGTNVPYGGIHQFGGTIERLEQSPIAQAFRYWRDVKVTREDGSSYIRKQLVAANTSHKITMMARTVIGAASFSIPARPYLGFDAQDQAETIAIINDHYGEVLK